MSLGVVVYFVHYGLLLFLLGQYHAPLSRAGVVVIEEISSLFVLGVRRVVRRLVRKTLVDDLKLLMPVGSKAATCFSPPSCDDFQRVVRISRTCSRPIVQL